MKVTDMQNCFLFIGIESTTKNGNILCGDVPGKCFAGCGVACWGMG
jgi:hypothetical protein